MSRYSFPPTPQDWLQIQDIVRGYYVNQKLPLKDVRTVLRDRHGFRATDRMIKARLKQWGYLKNAKKEDWHFLALLHHTQKDGGKQSTAFDVRGHRKTVKDLQRFIRNQGVTMEQFLMEARQTTGNKPIPDYIQPLTADPALYQDVLADEVSPDHFSPSPPQPSAQLSMQMAAPSQTQYLHPMDYTGSRQRSISASSNEYEMPNLPAAHQNHGSTFDMQDSAYISASISGSSSASTCTQIQWEFETCASQIINPTPLKSRIGHEDIHTWALLSHSPGRSDKSGSSGVSTEFVCSRCNQPSQQHFVSLDDFEPKRVASRKRDILNGNDQPLHLPVSTKEEGSWLWVSRCFLACMCFSKGHHEAAELSLRQAAIEFERLLDKKDRLLLTAAGLVMTVLHMHNQGEIAHKVINSANEVSMRKLPAEHPIRVTMAYLTASANLSAPDSPSPINSKTLKTVWHNLGLFYEPTHEYIIAARYNYAWKLKAEGHLDQAETEARAAHALSVKVLGKLHMQSITCLAVLAGCLYTNKSRLDECIHIFQNVVRDAESCLGVHHPYTLEAKRRMAEKLADRHGPSLRTLKLYKDVLWGRVQMLGLDHGFTVAAREGYEDELKVLDLWTAEDGEPSVQRRQVEALFMVRSPGTRSWTKVNRRRRPSSRHTANTNTTVNSTTMGNTYGHGHGHGHGQGQTLEFEDDDFIFDDDDNDDDELVVVDGLGENDGPESPRSNMAGCGAY